MSPLLGILGECNARKVELTSRHPQSCLWCECDLAWESFCTDSISTGAEVSRFQWATYIMHTNTLQSKSHVAATMMLTWDHNVDKLFPQCNFDCDGHISTTDPQIICVLWHSASWVRTMLALDHNAGITSVDAKKSIATHDDVIKTSPCITC